MKPKRWRLVAGCKNPRCEAVVEFASEEGPAQFDNEVSALAGLLDAERREARRRLVNSAWVPSEFERGVKAYDHPLPKDIQAESSPITCRSCGRTYLYSSSDAFLMPE
jgi:hypothetical protein